MSTTVSPEATLEADAGVLALNTRNLWWLWLVTGLVWIVAALVILQFETASVATIGLIIGSMFLYAGLTNFVQAAVAEERRWLWIMFGVLMGAAGLACFINPAETFAGLADMLGFLFLVVGLWWTAEAFLAQDTNALWWTGLIAGVLMIIMAFWTSGQFFIEKAYTLLVFAGVWALLRGITDLIRAFQIRRAGRPGPSPAEVERTYLAQADVRRERARTPVDRSGF